MSYKEFSIFHPWFVFGSFSFVRSDSRAGNFVFSLMPIGSTHLSQRADQTMVHYDSFYKTIRQQ